MYSSLQVMFYTVSYANCHKIYLNITATFIVTWLGLRSNILVYFVPRTVFCVQLADLSQLAVHPEFTHLQLLVFIHFDFDN